VKQSGLTVLEVIVALSVFTVGILAAVQLQASMLRAGQRATAVSEVTRMLAAELELQRHTANLRVVADPSGDGSQTFACQSAWVEGIAACTVTIERCTIADRALACGRQIVSGPAYRVRVVVAGRNGEEADVTTVTTSDRFIAGAAGTE
jgi:Tfp pilus assembly protein PilV